MFPSEWREFPSTPCLAGKKNIDDSSRLDVVEIARVPDMLPNLFIYVGIEVKTPFILSLYSSRTSEVNFTFAMKEVSVPVGYTERASKMKGRNLLSSSQIATNCPAHRHFLRTTVV